ncbi:kin of IRRE-like protein 1 [Ptychodera flava]|uniref:kin of IRRE-like protein 1 n=1 Tax=Ptychodera flava TaxID=63121 RepID=UPI003969CAD2
MYADYLLVPVTLHCVLFGLQYVSGVQFLEEPADVTKTYTYGSTGTGDSFFLDCQVDSVESDQKVSWFKNGEIISDGYDFRDNVKVRLVDVTNDRYRIISYNTPLRFTLQVRSVSPSTAEFDSGSYQCAVTWSHNDAAVPDGRSRTAEVNIYVIPTSNYPVCRVSNPNGQDVITAERTTATTTIVLPSVTHTLTCLSGQSTPAVGLLWSRDDQSGFLPREYFGVDANGLPYIAVDWIPSSNDGSTLTFTCTLQHPGLSSDRACSISFNVQYAPNVTIDPTDDMVTEENDEIVLHCNQDANPQVTEPVWYYDDDVVNSGGRFSLEGLSLRILDFSPSDNGVHTITCELTNVIGTGSDSVTLTVDIQYAPIVTIDPTDVMVTEENDEIVLHCNQDANPQVTAPIWYYDDDVVNSGGRFKLEGMSFRISEFIQSDNGDHKITCSVKSRDNIELNTEDNPGIESDMNNDDEQNYQVIKEYDATTVKAREESKVTDTGNYTNIPSRQFTGEDEHYQSLGKQSDNVYTGLTKDNKI